MKRGRPKIKPSNLREGIHLRLPRWIIRKMERQPLSYGAYVEKALVAHYGLKPYSENE